MVADRQAAPRRSGQLLAVVSLLFGVPLGIALGRVIWRTVAGFTPLAYHPPLALLAMLLVAPVAL
ncbi:MAG: hypothetical protein ABR926_23420, partial [Streptosporangiaceae bacterium]